MIKNRPYLMTGEKSLTQTNIFLRGYIDAYNRSHQEEPAQTFFPGFEKWVNQKERFKVYRPWHKIYLFITANEEDAFDLFYFSEQTHAIIFLGLRGLTVYALTLRKA